MSKFSKNEVDSLELFKMIAPLIPSVKSLKNHQDILKCYKAMFFHLKEGSELIFTASIKEITKLHSLVQMIEDSIYSIIEANEVTEYSSEFKKSMMAYGNWFGLLYCKLWQIFSDTSKND
jgi:hypothetical protein